MKAYIGKILYIIDSYKERFINQYKLSKLGSHGSNCHLEGKLNISYPNIFIGNNVMFGPNVMIATGNHRIDVIGKYIIDVKEKRQQDDEDVIIADDVWIGMNAIILKGVHIGEGSVIGAGTIVTKNVPPYSIVTNASGIKTRARFTDEEIII